MLLLGYADLKKNEKHPKLVLFPRGIIFNFFLIAETLYIADACCQVVCQKFCILAQPRPRFPRHIGDHTEASQRNSSAETDSESGRERGWSQGPPSAPVRHQLAGRALTSCFTLWHIISLSQNGNGAEWAPVSLCSNILSMLLKGALNTAKDTETQNPLLSIWGPVNLTYQRLEHGFY